MTSSMQPEDPSTTFVFSSSLPFYRITVPTVDTVRYNFLVSTLVDNFHPVMLVGPVGTGKTSVVSEVLNKVNPARYAMFNYLTEGYNILIYLLTVVRLN